MAPHDKIQEVPPDWVQDKKGGGVEGMEGKLNGNHLRLIPELCLEDRMN
jgi:hypothetical protein